MIACPSCGADSKVIETRKVAVDQARRRRRCCSMACGKKFTTVELPVEGPDKQHQKGIVATIARRDLEEIARLVTNALRQEGTTP